MFDKTYHNLKNPSGWLCKIHNNKGICLAIFLLGGFFYVVGIILNRIWPFPCFMLFSLLFAIIGVLSLIATVFFSVQVKKLQVELITQKGLDAVKTRYLHHFNSSPIYILAPLFIIALFGVGCCSIFGNLKWSPTMIWMIILFIIAVYFSIIGYVQYISIAYLTVKTGRRSLNYIFTSKELFNVVPANQNWLLRLTKVSHVMGNAFFTLGTLFILGYAWFCWHPEMNTLRWHPICFILWLVVFIAIVLAFPVISIIEHIMIKRIVANLKRSYIKDLKLETYIIENNDTIDLDNKNIFNYLSSIYASQIILSKDYPVQSTLTSVYAFLLSIFNFMASLISIGQGLSAFTIALWHIF